MEENKNPEENMNEVRNNDEEKKNGIFDGVYYENDVPTHKGVIITEDGVFYAGRNGVLVKGYHNVHREMSNGLLKRGTYKFDENGKMIEDYYKKPVSKQRRRAKKFFARKKKEFKSALTKDKMQKNLKLAISLTAVFVIVVVSIVIFNNRNSVNSNNAGDSNLSNGSPAIILPKFDEPVYLCRDAVKDYYINLNFDDAVKLNKQADPYQSLEFDYSVQNYNVDNKESNYIILEISTDNTFQKSVKKYYPPLDQKTVNIDNLMPDTVYYYRAYFPNTKKDKNNFSGYFRTAEYDRFIFMDGVVNVRDLGGTKTSSGKKVKYNMIIRGSELDGLGGNGNLLKNYDNAEEFGFVFEMDLREKNLYNNNYNSKLGDEVRHKFYEAPEYGKIFNSKNYPALKSIFSGLADEKNYPMYIHCKDGKDRAGTIVFLLQSVLGVNNEDKDNQYLLSKFIYSDVSMDKIYPIYDHLGSYKGKDINEQVVDFLMKDVGVTQKEIDSIRNILLE